MRFLVDLSEKLFLKLQRIKEHRVNFLRKFWKNIESIKNSTKPPFYFS